MRLQRQMQMTIILDHLLARQHRGQMRIGLELPAYSRARTAGDRPGRRPPQRVNAHNASRRLEAERAEGVGLREALQRLGRQAACAARDRGRN